MVKTTSLSSAAINALTTGDSSILYNNQSRDLVLYSGSLGFSQSGVFNLEINNINGECLKLKYNSSPTNYVDFNLTSTGQLNIIPNGSDKIINIYHHNGSTSGLSLGGTLITASATELNKLDGITATTTELNYVDTTQGIAEASKALIVDANRDISNIRNLQTENLTVNGTLVTSSATELNYNDITTIGTAEPGKALVADVNRDISNIRNLELTNNLTITNHNGINKGLILGNTLVSATASEINILDGVTATTTEINKLSGVTATTAEINKLAGITATTTELNYVDTTPGTVEASKAIIVDANRDISNIRNLQTENLTVNGTLITASASEINYNDLATIGTAEAGKALVVDLNRDISNIRNLTATNLTGSIQTASQTNITSLGTLNSLSSNGNVNIAQHDGSTTGLQLNSTLVTATANEINVLDGITSTTAELNILDGVTANANEINVLDGITATTTELNILDGVTATYAEINVLDGITATTAELNYVDTTPGTAEANKAIIVDSNKDISGINALSVTSLLVNGSSISTNGTTPPELSNITPGTASASKALVVDSNKDITSIRNLTATNLTGTLQTAAQTNITSVGTLTGLTSSGAISITNTTASSSSSTGALVVSGGVGIGGATNIGGALLVTENITGTLATANQPNITAVGTLTGLTSSGEISITNTTASSSSSTGALVISGGVGIGGAVNTANSISINRASGDGFVHNVTGTNSITLKSSINTANTWAQFGTSSNHELRLMTNGSSRIYISNTGAVTMPGSVLITSSGSLNVTGATTLNNVNIGGALSVTGNITGTLATAAQTSITSVGTLTGLTSSGIVSITNTTDSTSSSTGALVMSGGIGINDTADAISSTNGGSLTTAGGMAIAKKLFVGTDALVGGNLTVTGNLTISGTTTTVNTTSTLIKDNTLTLNSGPAGTGYDSGVLIQRFQDENNAGTGDVVNDIAEETYAISSATSTTATLPSGANITADYYKDWYIKITSGAGNNQVRKVIGYTGSTTRVLTLNTSFATTPSASDTINLYNKPISTILWQESNKQFITAFTSTDVSAGALSIIDYADLRTNSLIANRIRVGDSTDTNTTRMISALDSTITTGSTNRLIAVGKASSANNQAEMMFNWTADGSSSNNLRLGLHSAGIVNSTFILGNGNMGIGTSLPDRKLEINSSTGNCLRLTYNDTDGTATTYCDQTISSAGVVTLAAAGSAPSFVMSGGAVSITNTTGSTSKTTGALIVSGGLGVGGTVTANSLEVITTGSTNVELTSSSATLRLIAHTDNVCYIQTGDSSGTTNSSRDLFIGDFGKATSNLTSTNRKFIIKGGVVGTDADAGFVGIGTIVPSKQLEVRNATGDCLRLSYDDTDYFDTTVSSTGITTWTATGSASRFTFAGTSLITLPDNTSFKLTSDIGVSDYHLLHFNSSKVVCIGKNTVSNTSNWLEVAPAGGALFGGDVNIEGVLNVNGAANAYFGSNTTPISTTFIGGSGDVLTIDGTGSGSGGRNTILFKGNAYTWEFGTRNSTGNPNNAMYFFSKKNDGTENAYRMIMLVDGKIGLGTTVPATQLEINSATGSCLQLTYNDSNGGATTYCRQEVSSTGVVTFTAAGSAPSFTMAGGALSITDTTASTSATTGALKVSGGAGISHLVIGGNRTLAAWGSTGPLFNTTANTFTDSSSAANSTYNSNIAINSFQQSTLAASNTNVTYGQLTTNVFIANGPTAGTNTTIRNRCSLVTGGPIVINPGSISISDWTGGDNVIHLRSGYTTGLVTDTGSSNISGVVGVNTFNRVLFASNTAGRTMSRAATIYIMNAPSTSGGNMTITNSHALYIANGNTLLADTTASSSTTTGALVVSGGVGINGAVNAGTYIKTPYIQVGTSTDTSRLISCLDGITTVNSDRRITLGSSNSQGNQAEFNFNYQGSNNSSNRLSLGFHTNTTVLNILNSGDVNIGGITSGCKLIVTRTSNNNNYIRWTDGTTTADTYINSSGTPSIGSVSAHDFGFYTANGSSSQLYLKQGGNVGIGTNNPTSTLQVNGSLSKNSGTFDIQHPIKANTRLVHSFIEGPRCDLIYRGSIQLINGKAIVNLDTDCVASIQSAMSSGTFEALVQNPVCYLQNSTFDRIIGNINKNILTITCENMNANSIVNWMVIGERKDKFIKEWNRTDSEGRLITEY